MAQLIVRNLDDAVKDKLKAQAAGNGRSLEGEVRVILETAMAELPRTKPKAKSGLGWQMRELFANSALTPEEFKAFSASLDEARRSGRARDPGLK
jgi:antitoxin FitA